VDGAARRDVDQVTKTHVDLEAADAVRHSVRKGGRLVDDDIEDGSATTGITAQFWTPLAPERSLPPLSMSMAMRFG
jgi:hypothetical protein